MKQFTFSLFLSLGFIFQLVAQKGTTKILLHQEELLLEVFEEITIDEDQAALDYYYLAAQIALPITDSQQELWRQLRVQRLSYLRSDIWMLKIPKNTTAQQLQRMGIQRVGKLKPHHKIQPFLQQQEGIFEVFIQTYEEEKGNPLDELLTEKIEERKEFYHQGTRYLLAKVHSSDLLKIAALPYVAYIQIATKPHPLVADNLVVHHAVYVQHESGFDLDGSGIVVGVGDGGTINDHPDLNNRILNKNEIDDSGHASQVTGIIAGEGKLDERVKGFASGAQIVADYFGNMVSRTGQYFTTQNMSLANYSYANGWEGDFCTASGNYDLFSEALDQTTYDYPNVLHIVAAGNNGTSNCPPYPNGYNTVLNGIQSAKNSLTVGALQDLNTIWSSSSRGPTSDGRIKPEIVALGTNVRSTSTTRNYAGGSGTSFSTPSVTGAAALLNELYKSKNNDELPAAALLKSVLCNSATDLGKKGPDFIYGFGRLDVAKAAQLIDNERYITDSIGMNDTLVFTINVPNNQLNFKATIAWTDAAASPLSTTTLINDLDLEIIVPNDTIHYPWLLDTTASQVNKTAYRGNANERDRINNIEQVTLDFPIAGVYEIKVTGANIPMEKQVFHIAYDWQQTELALRYPLGGETFAPNQSLRISWSDSLGISNDTLQLYYSTDSGVNWVTINENIEASNTQYLFTLPNLATDEMRIRIQNKNNTLADTSDVFTVMSRPILAANPQCGGSVELTWDAVDFAQNYEIVELINGDWQQLATTTQTNYTFSNLAIGQNNCYSIRAVNASGIKGEYAVGRCVNTYGEKIVDFPYQTSFETADNSWWSEGKNNNWERGTPNQSRINVAATGTNVWMTDLDANYKNAALPYLYSPCFDLSNLSEPTLSFALWIDIENNEEIPDRLYDYLQVQYSTDGKSWTRLGSNGSGYRWYNNAGGINVWDDTFSHWQIVRHNIPTTADQVRFRWLLNSDAFTTQEGVAIDELQIYDAADSDYFVQLTAKVALEGAFEQTDMHDDLNRQNQIPLTQPYASIFNYAGTETITDPAILQAQSNDAIVDWVLVELYKSGNRVAQQAALLQRDGDIVSIDDHLILQFDGVEADDYQVVVRHRNHLGIMTNLPVALAHILLIP